MNHKQGHICACRLTLTATWSCAFPGCLANLLLCWLFRICTWIILLLGTSTWLFLYIIPSFTVNRFIASLVFSDPGCLVAAISPRNMLFLGSRVWIQAIIYSSGKISFSLFFVVFWSGKVKTLVSLMVSCTQDTNLEPVLGAAEVYCVVFEEGFRCGDFRKCLWCDGCRLE